MRRRILVLGAVIAAVAVTAWRVRSVMRMRREPVVTERQDEVALRVEEVVAEPRDAVPPWVEAADGECPATHPVKAKTSSGIYHLPGSRFYARTRPERCYVDATAAEADGYRAAKSANGSATRSST